MAWEGIFEDLEGQWAAQERRELDAEVADRTRRERALVGLAGRLVAHRHQMLTVRLVTGATLTGELVDVGDGWLALVAGPRSVLVVAAAVAGLDGLTSRSEDATRARRFGLGYALRGLSRDRSAVALLDRTGAVTTGTIDAVGADHLDLSVHHRDEPRRSERVRGRRVVPFSALVSVTAG